MATIRTVGRAWAAISTIAAIVVVASGTLAQSGRHSASERGKQVLHVIAESDGSGTTRSIRKEDFDYFEGGAPQTTPALSTRSGMAWAVARA